MLKILAAPFSSRRLQKSFWISILLCSGCAHHQVLQKGQITNGRIMATTEATPPVASTTPLASNPPHSIPLVLAVLDFHVNSSDSKLSDLGPSLTDLVTSRMASYDGVKIVERQRLNDVFHEMKLSRTGNFDPATIIQIGQMVGANVLIFGSLSPIGSTYVVSGRLVKVETGELIGGLNLTTHSINALGPLANQIADQIEQSLKPYLAK